MNRKQNPLFFPLVVLVAAVMVNCSKLPEEDKPESNTSGTYTGTATNKANSTDIKPLSLTITSVGNPVAGTYNLAGMSGKVSGSILGLILDLTLKPNTSGTTYTLGATADDNNTTLSGNMTGVESGTTVTYSVVVKK
ncbi:hypothetical protein [Spirosoma litoris]